MNTNLFGAVLMLATATSAGATERKGMTWGRVQNIDAPHDVVLASCHGQPRVNEGYAFRPIGSIKCLQSQTRAALREYRSFRRHFWSR